jgi:multicomponent K+:H+ antiporter subunit A
MSLALLLALPFIGSAVAALMPANARNAESTWSALVALVALVLVALMFPEVRDGGVIREEIAWLPDAGLALVLRIDGFAWMFAMLVTGIGLLVVLYARYYMSPADPVPRFFSFLLAFMGSMLGLVVAGNIIQLVFFWELTSLLSFMLIGYWHHRADARRGARMALIVTGGGGLCLLAGMLLLGRIVGSYDLDAVLKAGEAVRADPLYPVALGLVLLGAFTKSAQFPFHFWLPHAMAAPTPVSAYLHSATMVKAGVFLLARLWPVLAGTEAWFWTVTGVGVITLVMGAYTAMFQRDLKGLLAYSTISHLGLITLLLGLNSPLATVAAVFHMMNHATFKASLFMAAGVIDHETGTRDISRLNGLYKAMPITATLAIVASAAMAGVPLLNGFLSKEMFFAETVFLSSVPWVEWGCRSRPPSRRLRGDLRAALHRRHLLRRRSRPTFRAPPHEPTRWMRVPIEFSCSSASSSACFRRGRSGPCSPRGAPGRRRHAAAVRPRVWHGFSAPLMLSMLATRARRRGLRVAAPPARARPLPRRAVRRSAGRQVDVRARARASRISPRAGASRRSARAGCSRKCCCSSYSASCRLRRAARRARWGDRPRVPASTEIVAFWLIGVVCAVGRGVAGEVPPPCRADDAGGRRPRRVPHVRVVLGAGPGAHAARRRSRDDRAVPARAALVAEARRQTDPRIAARAALRRVRDFALAVVAGSGMARSSLRDADAAARRTAFRRSSSTARCPTAAARTSSTSSSSTSGLRHDGRDHGARRGRIDRVRAAAALPAAEGDERLAAAAADGQCGRRSRPSATATDTAQGTDGAGRSRAPACCRSRASLPRGCSCAGTTSRAAASSPALSLRSR